MENNTASMNKPADSGFGKEILRLAGILFAITAIVAIALGVVNNITEPRIAAIAIERRNATMEALFPGCTFEEMDEETVSSNGLKSAFLAMNDGAIQGMIIEVAPAGYGGEINTIVAVDPHGVIVGASITKLSETAGLGNKAKDAEFLDQFTGQQLPLNVVKKVPSAEGEIQAISSATITTTAVVSGVEKAVSFAARYMTGGSK